MNQKRENKIGRSRLFGSGIVLFMVNMVSDTVWYHTIQYVYEPIGTILTL